MKLKDRLFAIRKALVLALQTFKVRAFGSYVNCVGGPDDFDDGSIWEYKGKQYKFPDPKAVIIKVRITDLPQGMRDAIAELRLA